MKRNDYEHAENDTHSSITMDVPYKVVYDDCIVSGVNRFLKLTDHETGKSQCYMNGKPCSVAVFNLFYSH